MLSLGRILVFAVGVACWCGLVYGSTRLHQLDLALGCAQICGPWGCAAAPEALLGYHAFWASTLIPAIALVCRWLGRPRGAWAAGGCGLVGMAGVVGVFGSSSIEWLRSHGSEYAVQRGIFVIATTPDLPVVQLGLAGLVGRFAAGKRPEPVEPSDAHGDNPGD